MRANVSDSFPLGSDRLLPGSDVLRRGSDRITRIRVMNFVGRMLFSMDETAGTLLAFVARGHATVGTARFVRSSF